MLGALGVAVSAYGVHVKTQKMALRDEYAPLCDSEAFSCSEVDAAQLKFCRTIAMQLVGGTVLIVESDVDVGADERVQ